MKLATHLFVTGHLEKPHSTGGKALHCPDLAQKPVASPLPGQRSLKIQFRQGLPANHCPARDAQGAAPQRQKPEDYSRIGQSFLLGLKSKTH